MILKLSVLGLSLLRLSIFEREMRLGSGTRW
jgi:hypothetical protein